MTAIPVPIRRSNLFGSLADDEVREILASCQTVSLRSGENACQQGEKGESMFVIVRGRVSIHVDEAGGTRKLLNYLGPGDHFGEMSLLVGGSRSASVTAVTDTELLELTRSDFERSLARVPGFAANLSRSLGEWLRGQISGGRRPERRHVAIVRACPSATRLAQQLLTAVTKENGTLQVLSDQEPCNGEPCNAEDRWQTLTEDSQFEHQLLHHLVAAVSNDERVLVDIDASRATTAILMQQELIWWVVDSSENDSSENDMERALAPLRQLLAHAPPQLAERIQIVQLISTSEKLPAAGPNLMQGDFAPAPSSLPFPPFRAEIMGEGSAAQVAPRDVSRLTRQMRGLQVGLALGGGGARGIAHIGVLEVCEREGIYFDRVAGTSAGAIIAAAYAAGIPLAQIREFFEKEMTPPAAIAWIPKSPQWYMLGVFRLGMAEAKFRRYLHDYTFDQLLLPAQLVTVDLISGEHRIRSSGDVVNSVLESINHPVFGRPILRDGEALVDGGVLMNLPVTALRQEQVDYSVAIDVSKQLSREFAGNTRATPTSKMRRPGYISTLLRVTDVELKNLADLHGAECDFLIAPNTADFPFDDFTQAKGLVEAGQESAEEAMPRLKESLQRAIGWDRKEPTAEEVPPTLREAA